MHGSLRQGTLAESPAVVVAQAHYAVKGARDAALLANLPGKADPTAATHVNRCMGLGLRDTGGASGATPTTHRRGVQGMALLVATARRRQQAVPAVGSAPQRARWRSLQARL